MEQAWMAAVGDDNTYLFMVQWQHHSPALNDGIEQWIGKSVEGNIGGLIWDTILAFA